jgi:hypothetical protein
MAFALGDISANFSGVVTPLESSIQALVDQNPADVTSTDLLQLQFEVSQWSIVNTSYSTVIKTLGDTLKGTLQKIG